MEFLDHYSSSKKDSQPYWLWVMGDKAAANGFIGSNLGTYSIEGNIPIPFRSSGTGL